MPNALWMARTEPHFYRSHKADYLTTWIWYHFFSAGFRPKLKGKYPVYRLIVKDRNLVFELMISEVVKLEHAERKPQHGHWRCVRNLSTASQRPNASEQTPTDYLRIAASQLLVNGASPLAWWPVSHWHGERHCHAKRKFSLQSIIRIPSNNKRVHTVHRNSLVSDFRLGFPLPFLVRRIHQGRQESQNWLNHDPKWSPDMHESHLMDATFIPKYTQDVKPWHRKPSESCMGSKPM